MMQTQQVRAGAIPHSITPDSPFGRLISRLAQVDFGSVGASAVTAILDRAGIDGPSLAPYENFVETRYTRNGVYRDDHFELIVMCWPAGVQSPIHEHGGSRGFVQVLRGRVTAQNYTLVECDRAAGFARLTPAAARSMKAQELEIVVPGRDVHRVTAGGRGAVSLHLYAKPLDRFFLFDDGKETCREVRSSYDIPPLTARP